MRKSIYIRITPPPLFESTPAWHRSTYGNGNRSVFFPDTEGGITDMATHPANTADIKIGFSL